MLLSLVPLLLVFVFMTPQGEETVDTVIMQSLAALFLSGFIAIQHGQFVFSWDSAHFDSFIACGIGMETIAKARLVGLQLLCVASIALMLPFMIFFAPDLILYSLAFLFYNCGVSCVLLTFAGLWNRKPAVLDESAFFNYQGFSTHHYLLVLPLCIPPIFVMLFVKAFHALLFLASIGLVGLLLNPVWGKLIARQLHRRVYRIARSFR